MHFSLTLLGQFLEDMEAYAEVSSILLCQIVRENLIFQLFEIVICSAISCGNSKLDLDYYVRLMLLFYFQKALFELIIFLKTGNEAICLTICLHALAI